MMNCNAGRVSSRRIPRDPSAEVEVAGAVRDEDGRVVAKRIGAVGAVEDAIATLAIIRGVDRCVERDASAWIAAVETPTRTAALQIKKDARWIAFTYPELERRIERTSRGARGCDRLPGPPLGGKHGWR